MFKFKNLLISSLLFICSVAVASSENSDINKSITKKSAQATTVSASNFPTNYNVDPAGNITTNGTIQAIGNITGGNLTGTNHGDLTVSNVFNAPNATGMFLTAGNSSTPQNLALTPADLTNPGILIPTGVQFLGGGKVFSGNISALNLSATPNFGDFTTGNVDSSSPNATGMQVTTGNSTTPQNIQLEAANGSFPGALTAISQNIGGIKTFNSAPVISPFNTAGVVHNDASGNLTTSLIVNADVSATASIDYSKINSSSLGEGYFAPTGTGIPIQLTNPLPTFMLVGQHGDIVFPAMNTSSSLSANYNTLMVIKADPALTSPVNFSDFSGNHLFQLNPNEILFVQITSNSTVNGTFNYTIASPLRFSSVDTTFVTRDHSGNFSAGIITANLVGNASTATSATTATTAATATTVAANGVPTAAIQASAVTNAKMANMNANTIKANVTGSAAAPTDVVFPISNGTIPFSVSGPVSLGPQNITYNQYGKTVTLSIPSLGTGTSTSATFFTSAAGILPAALRPITDIQEPIFIVDAGVFQPIPGELVIAAATGTITIYKSYLNVSFTATGTAGFGPKVITYNTP